MIVYLVIGRDRKDVDRVRVASVHLNKDSAKRAVDYFSKLYIDYERFEIEEHETYE